MELGWSSAHRLLGSFLSFFDSLAAGFIFRGWGKLAQGIGLEEEVVFPVENDDSFYNRGLCTGSWVHGRPTGFPNFSGFAGGSVLED